MSKYIDIHIIQSIPTSNINSGEDGSPKTIQYGGTIRSRVSSQSWKRATREMFNKQFTNDNYGIRTKKLNTLIYNYLSEDEELDVELEPMVDELVKRFEMLSPFKIKDGEFQALTFLSKLQLDATISLLKNAPDSIILSKPKSSLTTEEKDLIQKSKTLLIKYLSANNSFDIAAFGRMVAEDSKLNVDASIQVADAFSVHEIESDYDFFTALDDLKESKGAAMLQTREINAPTLYRYANINITDLQKNLGIADDKLKDVVTNFLKSFILSMPLGKSNQHANRTLPSYVRFDLRDDLPASAADAFEDSIDSSNGYVTLAIEALNNRLSEIEMFSTPVKTVIVSKDLTLNNAIESLITDII